MRKSESEGFVLPRYIAFDVETPNYRNDRMSAIGITVVEDGRITDSWYSLVNPETYFDAFNIELTGISEQSVAKAPTFAQVWEQIAPLLSSGILVAHNAVFDLTVLRKCLSDYGVFWRSSTRYLCTVQMGRCLLPGMSHKLNNLCQYYGIPLDHHQAASDSEACAKILLRYMEDGADANRFIRTYRFVNEQSKTDFASKGDFYEKGFGTGAGGLSDAGVDGCGV